MACCEKLAAVQGAARSVSQPLTSVVPQVRTSVAPDWYRGPLPRSSSRSVNAAGGGHGAFAIRRVSEAARPAPRTAGPPAPVIGRWGHLSRVLPVWPQSVGTPERTHDAVVRLVTVTVRVAEPAAPSPLTRAGALSWSAVQAAVPRLPVVLGLPCVVGLAASGVMLDAGVGCRVPPFPG